MTHLNLLRRLAEQQEYAALLEGAKQDAADPAAMVLLALAAARLGDTDTAQQVLATLDTTALDRDARVDLAAVYLSLGKLEVATALLEAEQQAGTPHSLLLARLGFCRQLAGHLDEACDLIRESLALTPRLPVFLNLLRLCIRQQWSETGWAALAEAELHWQTERTQWTEEARVRNDRELHHLRLDLWLLDAAYDAAESWLDSLRDSIPEADWCALQCAWARCLQGRDKHAQAEERLYAALKSYSTNRELLVQLAELAWLQGRLGQGHALLQRAVRAAQAAGEPCSALWLLQANQALQSNPDLARAAIENATREMESLPDRRLPEDARRALDFQWRLMQAGLAAREQQFAAAEQAYHALLAEQAQSAPVLQGLGQLYMQLGRIDAAVDCFEKVKAIDPARGHAALINARHFPEDEGTLERLEQLARLPGQEGSVRASLLLQLASAWEKRCDYEKAFALADEANAANRRLLRYDPVAHRQYCARIRHAFSASLYTHRPGLGSESTLPVFVVGMPRSGTTLVEQMLAGHSRIHGAGELGSIPRIIAGLDRWERRTGTGRSYPDCVDDLDARVCNGIAESVLQELRGHDADADFVVDKLPHNFENIGLIKLLFPKARIISVRRDPRDIAVSNFFIDYATKHGGMGFAYDLDWIGEQLADHNLLMHHWQQLFPGEILEVHYEKVLADPETEARRMLDYLGVEWEPQVLDFNTLDRPIKTASVWQVRQPIYHSSKAKWRRYEQHLKPLIAATNRKIHWEPIEMVALPEPGWLHRGVEHYKAGALVEAERCLRHLLHHLPEHGAAHYMLGLVLFDGSYRDEGIEHLERAVARCPWRKEWREDLVRALRSCGKHDRASAVAQAPRSRADAAVDSTPAANAAIFQTTSSGVY